MTKGLIALLWMMSLLVVGVIIFAIGLFVFLSYFSPLVAVTIVFVFTLYVLAGLELMSRG